MDNKFKETQEELEKLFKVLKILFIILVILVVIDLVVNVGMVISHAEYDQSSDNTTVSVPAFGDADGNGQVNMGDVTKLERIILSIDKSTEWADANQDGQVNMGDVTKVIRIILGLDKN